MLMVGLIFSAVSVTAAAEEDTESANDAYIEQVVSVLRSQVISMRMILDHDAMKYNDNMVRHAEAFVRTFGMVGPMEWHAAEAYQYTLESDAPEKLSEEQFEEFAEISHEAMEHLKRSAKRYMRDRDKQLMRGAINDVIKSCGNCHSRLPEGTVPHVWKGLVE